MLHVTFGTHKKKQSFGSETPERQEQSSLCQAKNRSKRGFRTMMAAQSLVCVRFEKTETPARFEPMPSKKRADRMLHVTFGTHKKKQSFGSETPERQQQSSLCQAKNRSKRGFRTMMAAQSLVCVRFEKTETPARFEPMPSKKRADRMLHVSFGTHKKKQSFGSETPERQQQSSLCQATASDSKRPKHQQDSSPCQAKNAQATASDSKRPKHQQDSSPCQAKNAQTECFTSPLEPIKNKASAPKQANASMSRASAKQLRQIRKDRNTSKIRAHAKQKTRKQLRQIRKDRNTSKIRAHAKQKTRRQNASRQLWNP